MPRQYELPSPIDPPQKSKEDSLLEEYSQYSLQLCRLLHLTESQRKILNMKGFDQLSLPVRTVFLNFLAEREAKRLFIEIYKPKMFFHDMFIILGDNKTVMNWVHSIRTLQRLKNTLKEMKATHPALGTRLVEILNTSLIEYTSSVEKVAFFELLSRALTIEPVLNLILEHFRQSMDYDAFFAIYYWFSYCTDVLDAFTSHPNLDKFVTIPIEMQEDVIFNRYNKADVTPIFWLDHPHLTKFIGQCLKAFPLPETMNWGERHYVFELMMSQLGRHGVTDAELLQKIYELWQPAATDFAARQAQADQQDNNHQMSIEPAEVKFYEIFQDLPSELSLAERKSQAFANLSPLEQVALKRALFNGVSGLTAPGAEKQLFSPIMQDLRRKIRQEKGIPERISSQDVAPVAERTSWLENCYEHPLAPYLPLVGIEIESAHPREMQNYRLTNRFFWVMGEFCFWNGNDQPVELAPFPTLHPATASKNLDYLVDSGLLDLHAEKALSLHLNAGFSSTELMAFLIRFHFLCGRGIQPVPMRSSEKQIPETHTLRLVPKVSDEELHLNEDRKYYQEAKGLRLNTLAETKEIMRLTTILGAAFRAYEKIFKERVAFQGNVGFENARMFEPSLLLNEYKIRHSNCDPLTKKLAKICLDFVRESNELSANYLNGKYWTQTIPMSTSIMVGSQVKHIFPDAADHDDESRLKKQIGEVPVFHRGKKYPNLLATARAIGDKYATKVQKLLNGHLDSLAKRIIEIDKEEDPETRVRLQENYLAEHAIDFIPFGELDIEQEFAIHRLRLVDDPELLHHNYNKI